MHATKQLRNETLLKRMSVKDESAITEFIENNIGIVSVRIDDFIEDHPHAEPYREDLISEGYLALTQATHSLFDKGEVGDHPLAYIKKAIYQSASDWLTQETFPQVGSPRSIRRALSDGEVPRQVSKSLSSVEEEQSRSDELMEEIIACCDCDEERLLIRLRQGGMTDDEIANVLNTNLGVVYRLRRDIYSRFLGRNNMKGEA